MSEARDFLDALVALGMRQREQGSYANAPASDLYLDLNKFSSLGGMLEMMSGRLFRYCADLTDGLKTGQPQNEAKRGGDLFENLYSDPQRLEQYLSAMAGLRAYPKYSLAVRASDGFIVTIRRLRVRLTGLSGLVLSVGIAHAMADNFRGRITNRSSTSAWRRAGWRSRLPKGTNT